MRSPQHIVGAAAQDHTGAFLGQLLDDPALEDEDLVAQGQVGAHGVQAVQQAVGMAFFAGGHSLLGQAGIPGGHGDQLFVIELDAQRISHALGNIAPAGAVFTAQSDDRFCHNRSSCLIRPAALPQPQKPRRSSVSSVLEAAGPVAWLLYARFSRHGGRAGAKPLLPPRMEPVWSTA